MSCILVAVYRASQSPSPTVPGATRGMGRTAVFLAAMFGLLLVSVLVQVLEQTGRLKLPSLRGISVGASMMAGLGVVLLAWIEWIVWRSLGRTEKTGLLLLTAGLHLAVGLGLIVGFLLPADAAMQLLSIGGWRGSLVGWQAKLIEGLRLGATYAGLVVLLYLAANVFVEATKVRWRRIYSIAWQTIVESYRRMWAPWVVLVLFVVVLAFTSWFLRDQRVAELAKIYVGTLSVVISLLLTLMILILAPISIPNDIRQQTIYTVVSKPVRRLELIWGRLVGYMILVSAIVLVFGGISLFYLQRVVAGQIGITQNKARAALEAGRVDEARRLNEQAEQLDRRMSARVPLKGSLVFTDSRGTVRAYGIDVGMEQVKRSHIEGATASKATWRFGVVNDPKMPGMIIDRRLDVDSLLKPGSLEEVENRLLLLQDEADAKQLQLQDPKLKASETQSINQEITRLRERAKLVQSELDQLREKEKDLRGRATDLDGKGDKAGATALREQARDLHSRPIPYELNFNVYRTTKGELGEAVRASVVVNSRRPNVAPDRQLFPIHEYYTIRRSFDPRMLVGSHGELVIDVQCVTPNQYLGMAEDDFYILASQGPFWANYLRGLTGLWLQALVLTAIGLFAGTFLSWPVAFLLTLTFYLAGQVAIGFLQMLVGGAIQGGGPFESMIRLVLHSNQVNELDPTFGVVLAKTADQIMMPLLTGLMYILPNLSALDVSNEVAQGFSVGGWTLFNQLMLGLGYAVPFTIAAYFILKNREVAA